MGFNKDNLVYSLENVLQELRLSDVGSKEHQKRCGGGCSAEITELKKELEVQNRERIRDRARIERLESMVARLVTRLDSDAPEEETVEPSAVPDVPAAAWTKVVGRRSHPQGEGTKTWSSVVRTQPTRKTNKETTTTKPPPTTRQKSVPQTKKKFIVGTSGSATTIAAAPVRCDVHLWGLNKSTTVDMVREHLKEVLPKSTMNNLMVVSLPARGEYGSFRIAAPLACYPIMMSPDTWPSGARVRKYYHTRQSGFAAPKPSVNGQSRSAAAASASASASKSSENKCAETNENETDTAVTSLVNKVTVTSEKGKEGATPITPIISGAVSPASKVPTLPTTNNVMSDAMKTRSHNKK
jgi:hypothetical protein